MRRHLERLTLATLIVLILWGAYEWAISPDCTCDGTVTDMHYNPPMPDVSLVAVGGGMTLTMPSWKLSIRVGNETQEKFVSKDTYSETSIGSHIKVDCPCHD